MFKYHSCAFLGDLSGARELFDSATRAVSVADEPADDLRECRCRLLEPELDFAEREKNPILELTKLLRQINTSSDFGPKRRAEVLDRGLQKIERLLE